MKAEIGKTYAIVQSGNAHQIFTIDDMPEWHDGLAVVDITGLSVEAGDVFDGKMFSKQPTPDPAVLLAQARASMVISPLQGILTLGETEWGKVLAYRDAVDKDGQPLTPWVERAIIDNAQDWHRTSQTITFIGYLLGYTDEQMDDLFIAAAQVTA
jgi:hypothetical protein